MRPGLRRGARNAGALVLWLALAGLALAASIAVHLSQPIARRVAVQLIHQVLADEIRGELRIGALERVSRHAIVGVDIALFDPQGRLVVKAERLTLVPELESLFEGELRFTAARLEGAHAFLFDAEDGLPSFITAFDPTTPSSSDEEPLRVEVAGIELSRVMIEGELLGLRGLRANVEGARGHMEFGRDVRVRIDRARGTLLEPFGFEAPIDALSGTISTLSTEGVDLHARARRGGERAQARIRYAAPEHAKDADAIFGLHVRGQSLTTATLRAIGLEFIPELDPAISGKLDLHGPFSNLQIQAELSTAAGPARVVGRITDAGAEVQVSSTSMQLAKLREGVPEITVAGTLHIDAPAAPDVSDAPDAEQAETKLRLELEPLRYAGFAVPGFTVRGALTDDAVRIDGAESKTSGATIRARGEVTLDGAVDLLVRASFADIARDENLRELAPDAHGRLDADIRVQRGTGLAMHFSGRVALARLRYGPLEADRLVLQGSARGDPERPALRLDLRGQRVRVGDYALGDPSLKVRGGPRVYQADGQFVAAGRRTFNASAKVTAEAGGGFLVEADPVEFAVGEGSWRGAVQGLRLRKDGSVELELLRLASRSQRLEAHGVVRADGEDEIDAQLQDFDLAAVHALLGGRFWLQRGRADAHVVLSGDLERPDLRIQGALRDAHVMDVAGVNALYFVTYASGQLEADGEVDFGDRGVVRLDGRGFLDPTLRDPIEALRSGTYDFEVGTQALSLALVPAIARAGLAGNVSGSVRVQGTLEQPDFRGAIELDPLHAPGWPALRVAAQGGYGAGVLSLRVSGSDPGGPIGSAEGQLQLDWAELIEDPATVARVLMRGPWELRGETFERRLDTLPAPIAEFVPYPVEAATTFALRKENGSTSGKVVLSGSWEESLNETSCARNVRLALRGSLMLERDISQFEFAALSGGAQVVTWNGTLETPVDRWISLGRIERPTLFRSSARVNIESLERVPYLCEYGNGSLRAEFELDGGLSAEPILVGAVDATLLPRILRQDGRKSVRVRSCEGDPIRARLDFNADRSQMRVRGDTNGCYGGPIDVEALMPVVWDEWLVLPTACPNRSLSASLRFDKAQLKPLLDRIPGVKNSDALAHGEVKLTGVFPELAASGRLELESGRLYLVATGQELTEIDAALDFRGNWAKLEYLRARQESGKLSANGGIGFRGLLPERVRVGVSADRLPVRREGIDMGQVTTNATIAAEIEKERTRAVIKLHDLLLRLPDATNRTLQPLEPHPDVTIVTAKPEARTLPYPIELVIQGERGLTVQRNDFRADVSMELAVGYRDPNLNVGGHIDFLSGEFEAFGQRFEINSGALRFNGGTELNPDVYLIATQRPEGTTTSPVVVSVTGTLAEPNVTFRSDVCPGDVGAITYLVSGRCAADDPDVAQESGDARNQVTSGIVSGVLTLGVQSQLSGALPRIAIDSNRVQAGISSQSIIPTFMRSLVKRVYVQGGVRPSQQQADTAPAGEASGANSTLDFLIELYFPHSIVGSGRFAEDSWGLDVTWEP